MATPLGQDYLATVIQQANQAGEQMRVPAPSIPQIAGGRGMSMPAPPTQGQPSGGGVLNQFQSLPAKMAIARAQGLNPRTFLGAAEQARAPRRAMELEKQYQDEQFQQHVDTTRAAVKLFTPLMGEKEATLLGDMVVRNPKMLEKSLDKFFTATSPTTLQKQVEYVNELPTGSPERELAEKILFKNNGLQLSVAPDGSISLATGGEMPVQAAGTSAQQNMIYKSQDDVAKSLMMIHSIANDFNEDYLRPISQLKGAAGRFADKWNIPDEYLDKVTGEPDMKRWGAEQQAFARKSARRVFTHRKAITGVAGGEKEMEKIEASLANAMTDSPMTFKLSIESELNDTYDEYNLRRIQAGLDPYDFSGKQYRAFPDLYGDDAPKTVNEPVVEEREVETGFPDISDVITIEN